MAPEFESTPVDGFKYAREVDCDDIRLSESFEQYLRAVGLRTYQPRERRSFDNVQVMFEAVANGLGVALAAQELVGSQLAAGRLVKPFSNDPVLLRQSYYLVCRKERHDQPALRALRRALTDRLP